MQIDPGPIPTLTMSTPSFTKNFAASAVAIFPAHNVVLFVFNFFIAFIISATFLLCPCAVSTTIKSTFSFKIASALLSSKGPAPTAVDLTILIFLLF